MPRQLRQAISLICLSLILSACQSAKSPAEWYLQGYDSRLTPDTRVQFSAQMIMDFEQAPNLAIALGSKRMSTDVSGLIDMNQGLLEATTVFQYGEHHPKSNTTLQALLNLKERTLIMPVVNFLPANTEDSPAIKAFKEKFIVATFDDVFQSFGKQIGLPASSWADLSLPLLLNHLSAAEQAALKQLPQEAYQQEPMDDFGRNLGARYRISLTTTLEQDEDYFTTMQQALTASLAHDPALDSNTKKLLFSLLQLWTQAIATTDNANDTSQMDVYLDRRGRLLSWRMQVSTDFEGETAHISAWFNPKDLGTAHFSLPASVPPKLSLPIARTPLL